MLLKTEILERAPAECRGCGTRVVTVRYRKVYDNGDTWETKTEPVCHECWLESLWYTEGRV